MILVNVISKEKDPENAWGEYRDHIPLKSQVGRHLTSDQGYWKGHPFSWSILGTSWWTVIFYADHISDPHLPFQHVMILSAGGWNGFFCRLMICFVCGYFYRSGEQAHTWKSALTSSSWTGPSPDAYLWHFSPLYTYPQSLLEQLGASASCNGKKLWEIQGYNR